MTDAALYPEAEYNPVLFYRVVSLKFLNLPTSVEAISRLFFILATVLDSSAVFADAGRSKAELIQLRQKIGNLQQQLADEHKQEKSITGELEQLERQLSKLAVERRKKTLDLQQVKSTRAELVQQQTRLENKRLQSRQDMIKLVRSSYMLGQQGGLKLILSQRNPVQTTRSLSIYRYLAKARSRRIDEINQLQRKLDSTRVELDRQQRQLDQLLKALGRNREQLDVLRSRREQNLNVVREQMAQGRQQVVLFRQREKELERLLTRLQRQSLSKRPQSTPQSVSSGRYKTATPARIAKSATGNSTNRLRSPVREPITLEGFQQNKGNMGAPINGRIVARFGQKKPESGLRWEGLMFEAAEGQEVVAIYPGQVVFSDWFGGYGQLMVLDHGDGYMSLYGHNSLVRVKTGDTVKAGQPIGEAGSTGGLSRPGLYFEIRHNGDPRDPLEWYRI